MSLDELADVRDLLIGVGEAEDLLVAPRALAEEVRATRAALERCATWGDAREWLSRERYAQLRDRLLAPRDPEPPAEQSLDLAPLTENGGWPRLYYSDVPRWLPDDLVERYGECYSGLFDSGVNLPAGAEDDIANELCERGVRCRRDDVIEELFVVSEVS